MAVWIFLEHLDDTFLLDNFTHLAHLVPRILQTHPDLKYISVPVKNRCLMRGRTLVRVE
jgi:hypothetical protein